MVASIPKREVSSSQNATRINPFRISRGHSKSVHADQNAQSMSPDFIAFGDIKEMQNSSNYGELRLLFYIPVTVRLIIL